MIMQRTKNMDNELLCSCSTALRSGRGGSAVGVVLKFFASFSSESLLELLSDSDVDGDDDDERTCDVFCAGASVLEVELLFMMVLLLLLLFVMVVFFVVAAVLSDEPDVDADDDDEGDDIFPICESFLLF